MVRFRSFRYAVETETKRLDLIQSPAYRSFLTCIGDVQNPVLRQCIADQKEIERSLKRKKRLYQRYALRLARAIAAISIPELRKYALYRYLYGLTQEEIADWSLWSVRTVYRYGKQAKKAIEEALLQVSPKCKRIPHAVFRVKGVLRKKDYSCHPSTASSARLSAQRGSKALLPKRIYR